MRFPWEAAMGGLIQTKGTQRLADNFNSRFSNLAVAGAWLSSGAAPKTAAGSLSDAFDKDAFDLLKISDQFIAQNATAGKWPADGNDILYPSATMVAVAATPNSISFNFATGFAAPGLLIQNGSSVISLDKRGSIPNDTTVTGPPTLSPGGFTVNLSNPVNV